MNNGRKPPLFYHQLPQTVEDWKRLREFLKDAHGFVPADPGLAVAAIADTIEGEIASAVVLQMIPYAGPWYTKPEWRGHIDLVKLREAIDSTFRNPGQGSLIIQGYVALTAEETIATLAEQAGLRRLDCITLVRELDKKRPIPRLE